MEKVVFLDFLSDDSYLACEDGIEFYSGYDPGPVEREAPLRISLDVLIRITELSYEYVQQDHYTSEQKQHHQNGPESSATLWKINRWKEILLKFCVIVKFICVEKLPD